MSQPSSSTSSTKRTTAAQQQQHTFRGVWSQDEHDLFLDAMQRYPQGPWKKVADHIGTRSVRQVQTHAQKYHEKVARRLLGLRKERKRVVRPEHRLDDEMLTLCRDIEHTGRLSTLSTASSAASSSTTHRSFTAATTSTPNDRSCDSCGAYGSAWPPPLTTSSIGSSSEYASSSTFASTPSQFSTTSSQSFPSSSYLVERDYDEVITFGVDDALHERDDADDDGDDDMDTKSLYSLPPPPLLPPPTTMTFDVDAEAAARQVVAAQAEHNKHHHRDLPSFHDCMDFLIDAFSSSTSHSHDRRQRSSSDGSRKRLHRWGR